MYGYKTKHAILSSCISIEFENAKNKTKELLEFAELHKIVSNGMDVDTFGRNLIYLEFEKYLTIHRNETLTLFVELTDKGRSAYMSRYFLQKNNEILSKWFLDYFLAFCNLGILIAAIITISNSNDEKIKNIQDQLLKIDGVLLQPHKIPQSMSDTQTNKNSNVKGIMTNVLKDSESINTPTKH